MNFEEFEQLVTKIYDSLPEEIASKFNITIEQYPTKGSLNLGFPFGYWNNLTPHNVVLCYWVFRLTDNFEKGHIERVIKHEFEHTLFGLRHSEHK